MKVFYCVYVTDGRDRILLDAIRLIARPDTRHTAHITVRGPYDYYQDPRQWTAAIHKLPIRVAGVGTFFGPNQNTVFLHIDSPPLAKLQYKPDFPDSILHLTVYDGKSRTFAENLRDTLKTRSPEFVFRPYGIEPLVSGETPIVPICHVVPFVDSFDRILPAWGATCAGGQSGRRTHLPAGLPDRRHCSSIRSSSNLPPSWNSLVARWMVA